MDSLLTASGQKDVGQLYIVAVLKPYDSD